MLKASAIPAALAKVTGEGVLATMLLTADGAVLGMASAPGGPALASREQVVEALDEVGQGEPALPQHVVFHQQLRVPVPLAVAWYDRVRPCQWRVSVTLR